LNYVSGYGQENYRVAKVAVVFVDEVNEGGEVVANNHLQHEVADDTTEPRSI
jgi:hypothetical protein